MKNKQSRRNNKKDKIKLNPRACPFCKEKKVLSWRDYEVLERCLSIRSRIFPRSKTGACARHQRRLARVVKQARRLGLLPFVTRITN